MDFEHGWTRSLIAEVNRNAKKRGKPFTPHEFMVYVDQSAIENKEMSWEAMLAYVKNVVHPALGGQ